jgi:long-chain acyl-CoA synthetase
MIQLKDGEEVLKVPTEFVERWAKQNPTGIFLRAPRGDEWVEFSFEKSWGQIVRVAQFLKGFDLQPGARVGILGKNSPEWILADLAIWLAGFVSVPVYPNQSAENMKKILSHAEVEVLFVGKLDKADTILSKLDNQISQIVWSDSSARFSESQRKFFWSDVVLASPPLANIVHPKSHDLATIIYTSGTTGDPKGVMHSFRSFAWPAQAIIKDLNFTAEDRFFSYLPLAHVAERLIVETLAIYSGATISFAESLDTFAKNLQSSSPTIFMAVPRIWAKFQEKVLQQIPQKKLDFLLAVPGLGYFVRKKIKKALGLSNIRIGVSGAAPISKDLVAWYKKLGVEISEGYGMTENLAYSHLNRLGKSKLGTVGTPFRGVDCKLSPEGEILVSSPANMMGYYKNPTATAESFEGVYLKTGDLGSIDQQGYLTITGRLKDIFKTSKGKYIAPEALELRFVANSAVEQVCVVGSGLPQPIAIAVLTSLAEQLSEETLKSELKEYLKTTNKNLDPHERVSHLMVTKERWTPENGLLTPTLKIKRKLIEKRYQDRFVEVSESRESLVFIF